MAVGGNLTALSDLTTEVFGKVFAGQKGNAVTRVDQLFKPSRGIEPRTFRLLGGCSTTEP